MKVIGDNNNEDVIEDNSYKYILIRTHTYTKENHFYLLQDNETRKFILRWQVARSRKSSTKRYDGSPKQNTKREVDSTGSSP